MFSVQEQYHTEKELEYNEYNDQIEVVGFWVMATGFRDERSALPGSYSRKVGFYNTLEEAEEAIKEHLS